MKKIKLLFLSILFSFFTKSIVATNGDTLIVNPNPFDSITVIHFEIANTDTIYLDVFNLTGTTIKTYFNATVLPSGSYSFNFYGDTLPSGIYFVRLKINSTKTLAAKLIKVPKLVGLIEHDFPKSIQIYPNPTNSILNIANEQNQFQNSTIEIKNYLGQVVLHTSFNSQIDISSLSDAIYFLSVQNEENKIRVKIIKY